MKTDRNEITVLIRAKNESKLIGRCLDVLFSQVTDRQFDVLLIDSGSTDNTVEIAKRFPRVKVHRISSGEFNYGRALNLGVELAESAYVLPLSAHCVPIGTDWLDRIVRPLVDDRSVGATFCRQVPWPDCSLVERRFLERTFTTEASVQSLNSATDSWFSVLFSNAACCFSRELAIQIPFRELPFAEDRVWAKEVVLSGRTVEYVPEASVYHSHETTLMREYRVARLDERAKLLMNENPYSGSGRPWCWPPVAIRGWNAWRAYSVDSGHSHLRSVREATLAFVGGYAKHLGRRREVAAFKEK